MRDEAVGALMYLTDIIIYNAFLNRVFSFFIGEITVKRLESEFIVSNIPEAVMELGYVYWSEKPMLQDFIDELEGGEQVWDIGAGIGIYSINAAEGAEVVAFEPFEPNAVKVKENSRINNVGIRVEEYPLWKKEEKVTLSVRSDSPGEGRNSLKENTGDMRKQIIAKTADKMSDTLGNPDILKIDVEGSELEVLQGMKGILSRDPPRSIYLELHRGDPSETEKVMDIIEQSDYSIKVLNSSLRPRNELLLKCDL